MSDPRIGLSALYDTRGIRVRLHRQDCGMLRTAKPRGPIRRNDSVGAEELADWEERGMPVDVCRCASRGGER